MAADNYNGVPKKIPALLDEDGNFHLDRPNPIQGGNGAFKPMSVGSGVLVDGYALISDDSIGYHTIVLLTGISGSTAMDLEFAVDAVNKSVKVSGQDDRQFNYILINPGLRTPKS